MDYSDFLHLLHEDLSAGQGGSKKQIIRFLDRNDYHRCVGQMKHLQSVMSNLNAVQSMRIIQAISCPLRSRSKLDKFRSKVSIEEDQKVKVHAFPLHRSMQTRAVPWGVRQIKAPHVWSSTMGQRVRVGVIDTGVDYSHADLSPSLSSGINLVNRNLLPHDDNGHGTHIAGTIAASNQNYGIMGVAPRAIIHPVKAFDFNGTAYVSDIILGIDWCVQQNLDIINMSFGMKARSKALYDAVNKAYNAGIVVVASSGNDSRRASVDYPARFSQTISVGATNRNRKIASFSNRGEGIDIYAPGERVTSSWLRGRYNELSGTSMATSHVSGAIALLLSIRPGLSVREIKMILRKSALPIRGTRARKKTGELDAHRMLRHARTS